MLSVVLRGECLMSCLRLSAKNPQCLNWAIPETVQDITRFHTGLSWHFPSLNDQVLKIELFNAKLRFRVK